MVDWNVYFMGLAKHVAIKATCPVREVGAVLVDPKTHTVLSMGYNGAPRGMEHCGQGCVEREFGENRYVCKAVHAEQNAIYNAAYRGTPLQGCEVYQTCSPCLPCAQGLVQIDTKKVYFQERYHRPEGLELLDEAGIDWEQLY